MGKVHGSLTRAGKVKKQTPKVEPKDRTRKLIVGRAKKREQYRKRYQMLLPEAAAQRKKFKPNKQEASK